MKEKRKKGRIWKLIGLIFGVVLLALATVIFVQVDFSNPKDPNNLIRLLGFFLLKYAIR